MLSEMIPSGYLLYSPTNRCNYRCKHCILDGLGTEKEELSLKEIDKIWGTSKILSKVKTFFVGGEPFFRPDIVDIAKTVYSNSNGINFTTNGFYTRRIQQVLEIFRGETDLTFILSIDGLENTHDKIRGKGAFKKAFETMDLLQRYGVNFWVNTVIQEANVYELTKIINYFKCKNITHVCSPLKTFPGVDEYYNIRNIYTPDVIDEVLNCLSLEVEKEYVSSLGKLRIANCTAGKYSCYIDSEGKVYPCLTSHEALHQTDVCMGDLRSYNYDFDKLWFSKRANEVREWVINCEGCFVGCELSREINCSPNGVQLTTY